MKKLLKNDKNVTSVVNQAIQLVKYNPCCCCGLENCCGVKYKGTCPVFVKLKSAFYSVKEFNE